MSTRNIGNFLSNSVDRRTGRPRQIHNLLVKMEHEGHRPTRCAGAAFQSILKIVEIVKPSGNSYGSFAITLYVTNMGIYIETNVCPNISHGTIVFFVKLDQSNFDGYLHLSFLACHANITVLFDSFDAV